MEERQRLLLLMCVATRRLSLIKRHVKIDISKSRTEYYLDRVINVFVNIVLTKTS